MNNLLAQPLFWLFFLVLAFVVFLLLCWLVGLIHYKIDGYCLNFNLSGFWDNVCKGLVDIILFCFVCGVLLLIWVYFLIPIAHSFAK